MKKLVALALVLVAAGLAAACNQGTAASTPVTPQSSTLSVATDAARSNSYPVTFCHSTPDNDPAWIVIRVDNNSAKYRGHLRHGDYTTSSCSTLSSLVVGDDCTCCLSNTCGVH